MLNSPKANCSFEKTFMKPLPIVRVYSDDGDTHYVFMDLKPSEKNNFAENYDEIKVKRTSRKEALKPLILKRTE